MENQIKINIDQDKIESKYVDQVLISHNSFGFTFDFGQVIPQMNMLKILNRISMSPEHAKSFLDALAHNITNYETKFGSINLSDKMKQDSAKQSKIGFKIEK